MHEDSIQKASSVEVAERRKGSFLRPITTRGDSFPDERDGNRKLDDIARPGLGLTRLSSSRTPLSRGSSYQPDWAHDAEDMSASTVPVQELGSPEDFKDMLRMGRTQEMRRVFKQFSLISFGCLSQCTWEFILLNNNQTLEAGGCALLFWSYVWSFVGSMFITASLAEMASMTPSSAGQHFWVSEFASQRWQQSLSYVTAWSTLLGWQCGNASGLFLTGSLIQSMITIYRPANGDLTWQTIVFMLPCLGLVVLVNIYGSRTIATLQNVCMSLHILALIAIVAILGVLSPHIPSKRAFLQIENTEWPSTALAVLAGQTNANYSLFYVDAPIRLSEEAQDAAVAVPRAAMRSQLISGFCGLLAVAIFAFCIPSVKEALNHPTGYSLLYILQLSVPNGVIICVLLAFIVLLGASNIGFSAATARITYAFARDQGLPFSQWISKVHKGRLTPINAVFLTAVFSALLSLINLGSQTAFYGIVGLAQATQAMSYFLAISSVLYRRMRSPQSMPKARWGLGPTWGPVNNVLAFIFSINCFICSFAPPSLPVSSTNFNVAAALFVGAVILMMITYYFRKKEYVGPVARTRDTPSWNLSQLGTGQNVQFLTIPEEF
ncbi:GABA permease, partial [Aureobasidium melanogenum]|uniref:GABA permease n=1 Tax=Aureobasidium melanogenum (strain CBS 110374) TaxID=1043003 RepID=A0A074VPF8_AURM1